MKIVEAYRQRVGDDLEIVIRLHPETKEDFKTINDINCSQGFIYEEFLKCFPKPIEVDSIDITPKRIIDI